MSRLTLAALLAAAALLPASSAAAQAPPPEDVAAAAAYAAATEKLHAAAKAAAPEVAPLVEAQDWRSCRAEVREAPDNRPGVFVAIYTTAVFQPLFTPLGEELRNFSGELHRVSPSDPALRSARAVWRQNVRLFAALAAGPPFCEQMRAWAADGYRARAFRPVMRLVRSLAAGSDRKTRLLRAGARRLRELGVAPAIAKRFAGGAVDPVADAWLDADPLGDVEIEGGTRRDGAAAAVLPGR